MHGRTDGGHEGDAGERTTPEKYLARLQEFRDSLELMRAIYNDMPTIWFGDAMVYARPIWDLEVAIDDAVMAVLLEKRLHLEKMQGGQHGEDTQTQEEDTQA